MRFAYPAAFWLLLLIPGLFGILWRGQRRRNDFLRSFGDLKLLKQSASRFPQLQKPWIHPLLLLLSCLSVIVALADPRLSIGTPRLRAGVLDVVFLIDVSKSMAPEDYGTLSRLEKAREIAQTLLEDLQGNRVGIVIFAGISFRQAELTEDLQALAFILKHWVQVEAVQVGGSNIVQAIDTAMMLFSPGDPTREKLLLFFSDGGEPEDQENLEPTLTKAVQWGVRIITFGLGSVQPSKIPVYNPQKQFTGYLRVNEQIVTTRLNEETLRRIALATEGTYYRVEEGIRWSHVLIQSGVIEKHLWTQEEQPLFQVFLLLSLLAFGIQVLLIRL